MLDIENKDYYGIQAKWIYTANAKQDLLENHTLLINKGLIEEIIPSNSLSSNHQKIPVLKFDDCLLTPGLINMHSHAAMTFLKGIADDLKLNDWLEKSIWPNELKFLNEKLVYDCSQLACLEMISSGITTFNDMYFYPESTARAAIDIGMRSNIGLLCLDFNSNYASDFTDYLDKGFTFRDNFRDEQMITTSLAPHAPYTLSDDSLSKVRTFADQLGLSIHCHLHETQWEIDKSMEEFGIRPINRLDSLGLLGPDFMAVHCVHLSDSDLQIMSKNQINVISCPTSNLKLASGIPPINSLLKHSNTLSVGTDGSASNNKLNIIDDLKLLSLLQRNDSDPSSFLSSKDLIDLITTKSAESLGLNDNIGSIEIGKKADLAAFDLSTYCTQPVYDPLSTLIYSGGRDTANAVWVNGNLRYHNKKFTNDLDEKLIIERIKSWKNQIQ